MEEWFSMLIRQGMLYSLPLLITLSSIAMIEHYFLGKTDQVQFKLFWKGAWLPFVVTILFGRAIIFSLPYANHQGLVGAAIRFSGHAILCLVGWLLYTWALAHPPLTGLPPVHHWWAKVFMYLNLCLMALHLLPLPNMVMGEILSVSKFLSPFMQQLHLRTTVCIIVLSVVAASPMLDMFLGGAIVFPIYEHLASLAE